MSIKTILGAGAIAVAGALVAVGVTAPAQSDPGPAYVQASSSVDQSGGGTVTFDTFDANGISTSTTSFEVDEAGVYFIVAAPQVGGIEGGSKAGSANFWLQVNGQDVPDSNVSWDSAQKSDGDVIVSQGVVVLAAGDEVSVEWSSTGPNMEAIQPVGEPVVPSIIFSMFGVN